MISMENEKHYISQNLKTLIELRGSPSLTALADRSNKQITTRTLGGYVNYPEDNNPTIEKLQVCSMLLRAPIWTMLIKNFPYHAAKSHHKLTEISSTGYELLCLFEQLDEATRKSILDFAAYQVQGTRTEQQIRDVQAKYLKQSQSQGQSQITYPPCSEDFGKN